MSVVREDVRDDEILTLPEAAALLHVGDTTLRALVTGGRIPAARVNRRWLFLRSRLEAWLRDGGTGAVKQIRRRKPTTAAKESDVS